jgi:sulfide:quinone oxidoreductase
VVPDFVLSEVDNGQQKILSYDGQEVGYDLLVSVPVNKGAEVIKRSGMGNELNYVPVDKHTLQSPKWPNVWALGDAADVPTSKAGSVAHFMHEVLVDNLLSHMSGLEPAAKFDGHANCFIESGFEKGFLIDFNYDVEPLPGMYPLPGLGPFALLGESPINHWGKMMFRWIYWNLLLPGAELPFESQMSMAGKWA